MILVRHEVMASCRFFVDLDHLSLYSAECTIVSDGWTEGSGV